MSRRRSSSPSACRTSPLSRRRAGPRCEHALRLTIYTTRLEDFADINEAYAEFFTDQPPARAAVGVAALPKGALVEVDAILAIPE